MSSLVSGNVPIRVVAPVRSSALRTYRLQSPAKLVRGLAILLVAASSLFIGLNSANAGVDSVPLQSVVVSQGSSLWQLAEIYASDSQPEEWVAKLVEINKLTSSILIPGQKLLLPAG